MEMSITASLIQRRLEELSDPAEALFAQRFFKTAPGEYGEGDIFRGIRVPVLRKLSKAFQDTPLTEVLTLLASCFHEDRLLALLLLMHRYSGADELEREILFELYLANTRFINNWDLVDISAPHIPGRFLLDHERTPLYRLAGAQSLWERRIAVIATFYFIRKGEFEDTFAIAGLLIDDRQDLIHKAAGWMLREVGKRDMDAEEGFLREYYRRMPRTMLRYAIERFPEELRQRYLRGEV
ncbi:MAG: DNA alkylation repair protein [Chlorobiaceae bacterium]|nr:DNA alkylation repair protein [Chlorobiaceae bacterium]NTW09998.1 DNA alkylation repair protein [Chlorobiaceae bacterium]